MFLPVSLTSWNNDLVYMLAPLRKILTNSELRSQSVGRKHQLRLRLLLSSACPYKGLPPTV